MLSHLFARSLSLPDTETRRECESRPVTTHARRLSLAQHSQTVTEEKSNDRNCERESEIRHTIECVSVTMKATKEWGEREKRRERSKRGRVSGFKRRERENRHHSRRRTVTVVDAAASSISMSVCMREAMCVCVCVCEARF